MLLFLLTLFASNAFSRVLTWSDCVELVSKNNPELAAARSNYSSTQELQSGSIGNYLPSLTASVNANYNFPNSSTSTPTFTSVGGAVISTNQSSKVVYSSALTLNYNLFSGFRDRASYDRAKANCAIASANLDLVRSQISYRLRQAFVALDYAQEYIKLTDSIIERRSQNERLVRAQYESGRENQGSYLLSQSVLEQAQFDRFQAGNRTLLAGQALAHVLGEDGNDLDIQGEIPMTVPQQTVSVENLLPLTPAHRTEDARVSLAEANMHFSRSAFFPSLDFSTSVVNRSDLLYVNDRQQWSMGLNLTIPLFSGFKTLYETRSARALEQVADFNRLAGDFDTLNQLRQAFYTFQESYRKVKVDVTSLNATTVQETIARKQYNNGLLKFENWDIIEGNLISAQKNALTSKRDRMIAESNWRQIQGQGDLP